jgi:DNA-binding response OmpR family regulator
VRVLLVENNAAAREQMGHILRSMPGVRIEFMASTQNDATSWLDAHPSGWDLALIDIFLDQGNGFAVLRHCSVRADWQRVAMISDYTRDPAKSRALEEGADAFFEKATELPELIAFCFKAKETVDAKISLNT